MLKHERCQTQSVRLTYFFGGFELKNDLVQITRMSSSEFLRLAGTAGTAAEVRFPPQLDINRLSSTFADSVARESAHPVPVCTSCGLCCVHFPKVPISFADSEILGSYVEITHHSETDIVVDRLVPRDFEAGTCGFLAGEVGREVECEAYDRRPPVCRGFEAGSDRCHELRRMYGLEPQLSDEDVEFYARPSAETPRGFITHAVCEVESVSLSYSFSADAEPTPKKSVCMAISVVMDGDVENPLQLHTYNLNEKAWLQSEFIGKSLDQARELISERVGA